jgi:hypothetical protein
MNASLSRIVAIWGVVILFALPARGLPPSADEAVPYEIGPLTEPRILDVVDDGDPLEPAIPPAGDA